MNDQLLIIFLPMRKSPGIIEKGFTVISLMMYSGGPLTVILSNGYSQGEGLGQPPKFDYTLIRILFQIIYSITLVLLVLDWKRVIYFLFKDKILLLIIGMVALSFTWSFTPTATLTGGIALIGTTLFGIYFATRYRIKQQLQLLGWMFSLVVILCFGFALGLPKYGVMGGVHAGAWRGIYTHKNVLGKMMTLGSVILWLLTINRKKISPIVLAVLALAISLLLLAKSTSSGVNFIVLFLTSASLRSLWLRHEKIIPVVSVVLIGAIGVFTSITAASETLLGSVGKDATLTGRTQLWEAVKDKIQRQPWLGYGFDGFWQGINSEAADVWRTIGGWPAPNAHNGVLDIVLSLGLIGISLIAISFLLNVIRSVSWIRLTRSQEGLWPMLFMTYVVMSNSTETSLLVQNNLDWVLYVAVTISLLSPSSQLAPSTSDVAAIAIAQ